MTPLESTTEIVPRERASPSVDESARARDWQSSVHRAEQALPYFRRR